MPGGATATLVLQWGNRFGQAADDYALCVRDTFSGQIVACYTFTGAEPPGNYTFISGFAQLNSLTPAGNVDQDVITFLP